MSLALTADPKPEETPPDEMTTRRSRAGRKTNAERARRAEEAARQKEQEARERNRAQRFYADSPTTLLVLLGLTALLCVASFAVSFYGLYSAAAWAVGDSPVLQAAVPVMLDMAIVAFTLALFVERDRGEPVTTTWIAIGIFAGVSSIANVLHALQVGTGQTLAQTIVGAVIAGGAPALLAFASDKVAVKVFR